VRTRGTLEGKLINGSREVSSSPHLLCVEPDSFGDVSLAAQTPYVERHLEPDHQNALGKLSRPFPERVLSSERVQRALGRTPLWRVILVGRFSLCHGFD